MIKNLLITGLLISSGQLIADTGQVHTYTGRISAEKVEFMGTTDELGKPDYLLPEKDVLSVDFLKRVQASLPESKPLPVLRPQYIVDGVGPVVELSKAGEVFITVVDEGAWYRNTIGYYTYAKDSPPSSIDDISKYTIIFPNFSMVDKRGGLEPGHKVSLGTFPAGTVIGTFLFANAWREDITVAHGYYPIFANNALNPESDESLRQHSVAIHDEETGRVVIGFEDIRRDYSSCDQDFNDSVYYITASPSDAIATDDLEKTDIPEDADGDGVSDADDDFPNDAARAFKNYKTGTLAFEDRWPSKADYDFNDLVTTYNFEYITDATIRVKEINASFTFTATGASLANGLAFEIPTNPNNVQSVSGNKITKSYITFNGNGTEANQDNAVIIVTDNVDKVISKYANVIESNSYVEPVTLTVKIIFNNSLRTRDIGFPPYKPFLIKNGNRGIEIHLKGNTPTALHDFDRFNTVDDKSAVTGQYFTDEDGMPWAIDIPSTEFNHMIETISIDQGYNNFKTWANTRGSSYTDWYLPKTNYRTDTKIYSKSRAGATPSNNSFNFSSTKSVEKTVSIQDGNGASVKNVRVFVYDEKGGTYYMSYLSSNTGVITIELDVPSYLNSLHITYTVDGVDYEQNIEI